MAISPVRVQAYDRRIAAIHEAGHALMAIYLGYGADAWIHPNLTDDPLNEKTWLGHMTMRDLPSDYNHPHIRMVAVAGMVAERLWKNGHDDEYAEPYGWDDCLQDEDSMSYSDWRLSGCAPGEPDDDLFEITAQVARVFMSEEWSNLTDMSRTLMSDTEAIHSFSNGSPAVLLAA